MTNAEFALTATLIAVIFTITAQAGLYLLVKRREQ